MGILFSCIALFTTYWLARRSLVHGIVSVLAAGYVFGILRANFPDLASYFIFDAAVVGLYAARISQITRPFQTLDGQRLKHWVAFLMLWPLALFFIPQQDPIVQIVGLRGNMFLLPFVLIGAQLEYDQIYEVALWMATLNIGAFLVAGAQFVFGVEHFFPVNPITYLIYQSNDVGSMGAYRIPSVFANAHSYGGMMVMSLPWLAGAWVQRHRCTWHKNLLLGGLLAAILGVFMSAARSHFLVLLALMTVFTFSTRLRPVYRVGWLVVLLLVGYVVSTNERLQRFKTLGDQEVVTNRFQSSVNLSLLDAVVEYPFGVGLGGGGTSIPYFLIDKVDRPVAVESEVGRIHLETGLIGLSAWIIFVSWIFLRPRIRRNDPWLLGLRLAWFGCLAFFGISIIGIGLMTAIPSSASFLMSLGWIATHHTKPIVAPVRKFRLQPVHPQLAWRMQQQRGMARL